MESGRSFAKQNSRIPSFNDLNTLTHDEDIDFSVTPRAVSKAKPLDRTWSVESAETPRRCAYFASMAGKFVIAASIRPMRAGSSCSSRIRVRQSIH